MSLWCQTSLPTALPHLPVKSIKFPSTPEGSGGADPTFGGGSRVWRSWSWSATHGGLRPRIHTQEITPSTVPRQCRSWSHCSRTRHRVPPVEPTHTLLTVGGCAAASAAGTGCVWRCAALGCTLSSRWRPAPEAAREPGGGAAGPVPGAGWRRARGPGTGLGAPPAGSPLRTAPQGECPSLPAWSPMGTSWERERQAPMPRPAHLACKRK